MTSTNNPYHDEDAVKIDIDTTMVESPFLKTLKHLGDAFKGGFCNREPDESKAGQFSKIVDTSVDSYSLSDESLSVGIEKEKQNDVSEKEQEDTQTDSLTFNGK